MEREWQLITAYIILSPLLTWMNKYFIHQRYFTSSSIILFQQLITFCILVFYDLPFAYPFLTRFNLTYVPSVSLEKDVPQSLINEENIEGKSKNVKFSGLMGMSVNSYNYNAVNVARISLLKEHATILFLSCIFTCQLVLTNYGIQLDLASYQIARSSTIIFTVVQQYIMFPQTVNRRSVLCCTLILLASFMNYVENLKSSKILGQNFLLSVMGSFCGVIYMLFCYKIQLKRSEHFLTKWVAGYTTLIIAVYCFLSSTNYQDHFGFLEELNALTIAQLLINSFLSFTISCACMNMLRSITPLGCTILGVGKGAVQSFVGSLVFQDRITLLNSLSVLITLFTTYLHTSKNV